jgi:hypothetical protein
MASFASFRNALLDPVLGVYHWRALHGRTALFNQYCRQALAAGIDRLYYVLSFDCDAPEDIEAAMSLHQKLLRIGVHCAYAVPGELLERGAEVYREIAESGAEFLNHGYRQHVSWDAGQNCYSSLYFYDRLSYTEILEDIRLGDLAIRHILGRRARGFRTPHFGTFQRPSQLRLLHSILRRLGYQFSSSTTPYLGFRSGPVFSRFGLPEFPLSGMFTYPLRILDSWGCCEAPQRNMTMQNYLEESRRMTVALTSAGQAGIANFYVDPRHVEKEPLFIEAVERWLEVAESTTYSRILASCCSNQAESAVGVAC